MRVFNYFIFIILLFLNTTQGRGSSYFKAQFINIKMAEKKWGIEKFNSKKFQTSNLKIRAKMAVYIAKYQLFKSKSMLKVLRQKLGSPDGYLFSEIIYGYKIQKRTSAQKESWQLVFIPSQKDMSKVGEVKIHKKCCYKKPSWLE